MVPAWAQSGRPAQTLAQLKDTLRQVMEHQHIPGMILVLTTRDSVLYAGGLGYADVSQKTPVNDRHLFRMGSVTKMFTALGILNLVQAGKLKLDDPVRKLAPELPIDNPWEATHPVRVIHLLEHTAGFSDKTPNKSYNPGPTDLRGLEAVQIFAPSLHSRWKPGERHSYVNTGYNVAAYLIEKLSGKPWEQYMTETVFRPMGMTRSNVTLRADASGRYAQGYFWQDGAYHKTPFLPLYQGGNGSLNSCAADMATCLQLYLNDWRTPQGQQYLSQQVLNETERPHTTLAAKAGLRTGYGLGNFSFDGEDGFLFHGHSGSIGAFVSSVGYNRELGVGYAFAMNTHQNLFPIERLVRLFLTQSETAPAPITQRLDVNAIKPFLGYYRFDSPKNQITGFLEQLRFSFSLCLRGDTLVENELLGGSFPLVATGFNTFRMRWNHHPETMLVTDSDGQRAVMENGLYYRQVSWFAAWMPIILLLTSLFLMATALIAGLAWLVMILMRRIRRPDAWVRLLPVVGFITLIVTVFRGLIRFDAHTIEGTSILLDSWLIFVGTLIFPLCILAALILLVLRWKHMPGILLKSYLVLILLAGFYVAGLMLVNGWLGIRIWAL
ncbi:hypothetical protein GCM10027423_00350 [Spirosoma arcticum]